MNNDKYPRTYHLPFSPGATKDDKKLPDSWFDNYRGKEVVITEKMDGANSGMNCVDVYARSHGAPTRDPWSRNLWDPRDGLYWRIRSLIGPDEMLFGENMYGVHSIEYNRLTDYFYLFAVRNDERWYSWDEVEEMADMLNIQRVPVIWRGVLESEEQVAQIIRETMTEPSAYGDEKEGVVMRTADSFDIYEDGQLSFPFHVCKYVRANHVQTDEHWTRNWKKAELIKE